jgi:hypothetical protein
VITLLPIFAANVNFVLTCEISIYVLTELGLYLPRASCCYHVSVAVEATVMLNVPPHILLLYPHHMLSRETDAFFCPCRASVLLANTLATPSVGASCLRNTLVHTAPW